MAHARGRFRHRAVRRQHPHAGAVLLQPRHGLQAQGLAPAARQRRRRAARRWSTCCRSAEGETITTVMPLPEDEASWATLNVMFATARGDVRRNELSDFMSVNQNGKIAMKLEGEDAGDRLIGVGVCSRGAGRPAGHRARPRHALPGRDVRVFQSRASTGVRGIALAEGDEVISMSLVDSGKGITTEERDAYLRQSRALRQAEKPSERRRGRRRGGSAGRRGAAARDDPVAGALQRAAGQGGVRPHRRLVGLRQAHLGLRVPGDRPRRQGRRADEPRPRAAQVVAAFPVLDSDQIMLVTDGGTLIRCPVGRRPHRGTRHPGRAHRQCERGRARGFGRAHRRGRARRTATGNGEWRGPFRNKRWIRTRRVAKTSPRCTGRTISGSGGTHGFRAHRGLSGHVRSHHKRAHGSHPPLAAAGRQAGDRPCDQYRQGAAVLARGADRDHQGRHCGLRRRPSKGAHRGRAVRRAADPFRARGRTPR